ncbi:MAG: 16S rRNA (uracil(1498)-N(3))-methyltransferase [Alphaproteobacteria bacterium]|nr:16S rRNA (uracil(1498)-N(3))-methyltransferase [Alphaproteobacteria bacterium]
MSKKNRIRLFSYEILYENASYVPSDAQIHYLKNVMRLTLDDEVFLFDGQNGEFRSVVADISKKSLTLQVQKKVYDFEKSPDVWLVFAPLKKENTDIVLQKAVELGVSKIMPVQTEYATKIQVKRERAELQIIEAAEQSRRQDVPELLKTVSFDEMIKQWPENRKLIYLNETGKGMVFSAVASELKEPVALLVGPEGGFSKKELEILEKLPYTLSVTLGKRILRAETAAIAALSCWQAFCGDWR